MSEEKKSIITQFKEFISRGNVLDMAVGVVVGGAFTKIVNSLVSDLIMPALGVITGKIDMGDLKVVLEPAVLDEAGAVVKEELAIRYGLFLDAIINFLLVAIAIFAVIKVVGVIRDKATAKKRAEEEAAAKKAEEESAAKAAEEAAKPDPQLELLTEIRDLLKNAK